MTKRLDPEMKALRAFRRALDPLDEDTRRRVLEYTAAFETNRSWVRLPAKLDKSR